MRDFLFAIWGLAGPSALILLLFGLGTLLLFTRRQRLGRFLCAAGLVCLVAITVLPLDCLALRPLETRFPPFSNLPPHVDGIIVLAGAFDDSIPSARGLPSLTDSSERMVEFARLARVYPKAKLVFTGGSRQNIPNASEADAARQFLDDVGIDTTRVTFERQSRNTYQNALFSNDLIKPKPGETWLLVTSAMHMPRAVGTFRHIGWQVIAVPAGYKSSGRYMVNLADHLKRFDEAMHEWQGLIAYRLEGRTDVLFPVP